MARETYAPEWAPWAKGTFERPEPMTLPSEIWVELSCDRCGATHRKFCESGAPRGWVLRWALVHAHRDPLKEGLPGK